MNLYVLSFPEVKRLYYIIDRTKPNFRGNMWSGTPERLVNWSGIYNCIIPGAKKSPLLINFSNIK